ncbi:MAG: dTMP kinase [Thermoleophilia bacterium]
MNNRFISFEGLDGCGKSTQARLLATALRARGLRVVEAREPGGTPLGDALRGLLLHAHGGRVAPAAEIHLFAASRAQLVADVIGPALEEGAWVVCDRFVDSSLAYQGAARGFGVDAVWQANLTAVDGCMPGTTFLVELPPQEAQHRRVGGGDDRIEAEGLALQREVQAGYRELVRRFPERIVMVDGMGDPDDVHRRVLAALDARA